MGKRVNILNKEFFDRNPDVVARELLGKILCRKIEDYAGRKMLLKAIIVETEAYFSEKDPASRASKGDNYVHRMMKKYPGSILVYNVHMYNMLNFVCLKNGKASAVLIRSVEPLNFYGRCSGPGLLTNCLEINKDFNRKEKEKELWIESPEQEFKEQKSKNNEIETSFRIGVKKDLEEPYRYFLKGNQFVSKMKK